MAVIIWNRHERDVVKSSGRTLVFATSADADVWIARNAVKNTDAKTPKALTGFTSTTFDKLTVT